MNKVTKLSQTRAAKQELNEKLGGNIHKLIYELLTNIPKLSMNIVWDWEKLKVKGKEYLQLTFSQDVGTDIDVVLGNLLTSDKLDDDEHYEGKPSDTGSVFGTGLSLIDYFTTLFTFSTNGVKYDFKTDIREDSEVDDKVVIEMLIPFHGSMIGFMKFIQKSREIIASTDMFIKDRTHEIRVSGFTSVENVELSKPIEYPNVVYKDKVNKPKSTPDYNHYLDEDGNPLHDVIINMDMEIDGKTESRMVNLSNTQVGKLYESPKGLEVDKDKPMTVLVCKESGQILGKIYWKGSYAVSINNTIVFHEVSKEDVRWLFSTADKFVGFNDVFVGKIRDLMRYNLLKYYPSSQVMEIVSQKWIYDVLVDNLIGKKPSDMFRDELGLGFMNDMDSKTRKKIVHMEWSDSSDRYDFHIFNAVEGKVTQDTDITLIECKRKGFKKGDMEQLVNYLVGKPNVVNVIGTSLGISGKQFNYWNSNSSKIQGSGQLSHHVEFTLMDIMGESDDWGFEQYVDEYTKTVVEEIEKRKSTTK